MGSTSPARRPSTSSAATRPGSAGAGAGVAGGVSPVARPPAFTPLSPRPTCNRRKLEAPLLQLDVACRAEAREDRAEARLRGRVTQARRQLERRSQRHRLRLGGRVVEERQALERPEDLGLGALLAEWPDVVGARRRRGRGRQELAALADAPDRDLEQRLLRLGRARRDGGGEHREELVDERGRGAGGVGVRDEEDGLRRRLAPRRVARRREQSDEHVDVPARRRREAVRRGGDLGADVRPRFCVGDGEIVEHLADELARVVRVDERVRKVERAAPDRDVRVAQALDDDGAVALHRLGVEVDDARERLERDVLDVRVARPEELAERVDGEDAEARLGLLAGGGGSSEETQDSPAPLPPLHSLQT